MFKVAPEKMGAFMDVMKLFTPTLDKLLAAGTITGYGVDNEMYHRGGTNVDFWISGPDFAAIDAAEKAVNATIQANPEKMKAAWGLTEFDAHRDLLVRSLEGNMGKVPAGALPVTSFNIQKVKPGKMGVARMLYRHFEKPALDKLVADGVIYGYSMDVEVLHSREPGTVWFLTVMPNLAAQDKVRAALRAAFEKMPAADREAIEEVEKDIFIDGAHRDSLSEAVIFKSK